MNHLFTDDNPETTLSGLGFKTPQRTLESIERVENYFDDLEKQQELGQWTPPKTRPREFIETKYQRHQYYRKQKMYRILGLLNMAKVVFRKTKSTDIFVSIKILEEWMEHYREKLN